MRFGLGAFFATMIFVSFLVGLQIVGYENDLQEANYASAFVDLKNCASDFDLDAKEVLLDIPAVQTDMIEFANSDPAAESDAKVICAPETFYTDEQCSCTLQYLEDRTKFRVVYYFTWPSESRARKSDSTVVTISSDTDERFLRHEVIVSHENSDIGNRLGDWFESQLIKHDNVYVNRKPSLIRRGTVPSFRR